MMKKRLLALVLAALTLPQNAGADFAAVVLRREVAAAATSCTTAPTPVLLLHMDGTNTSTTFTDSSAFAHTVTAFGDAQLDTGTKEFGTASGKFDGTGDYLTTPSAPTNFDYNFGSSSFTITFWEKSNGSYSTRKYWANFGDDAGSGIIQFDVNDGNAIYLAVQTNGSPARKEITPGAPGDYTDGNWHFIELSRYATTLNFFVDGTSRGTAAMDSNATTVTTPATSIWIGINNDGGTGPWNGWMDEFQVAIGTAIHTANYTPPAAPWCD